ncbi:MAG: 9-O-acetylesterase [Alphaproteobacteria bacterium]|nr:9-O-acetylesterase [Alphaproteobacteria bacterium]MDE2264264.1 9-O-acetylesterase [Alphaproteobacteria bacterium]
MSAALPISSASAASLLADVFQDHAVLQRDKPIEVWGDAAPRTNVTVTLAQSDVHATADDAGHWNATLPAMPAGGPYTLAAHTDSGTGETINDVLVGDVWLCSGQSNMALPVKATMDAGSEIATSANDTIRLLTVSNDTSAAPLEHFISPVKWLAAGPLTVPDFSATCYYFARDLQRHVNVPMGLIFSAWSGANIKTFMGDAALRKVGGYDDGLDTLKLYASDQKAAIQHWGNILEVWWRAHLPAPVSGEPWSSTFQDDSWPKAPAELGYWTNWGIPALKNFTGNVWFRTTVMLTASQAAQGTDISLGNVNEEDETWINGHFIGDTFGYGTPRHYKLPANTLHAGENSIVLNVLCTYRGCGMFGPQESRAIQLQDGTSVPLNSPWRYNVVPPSIGQAPRAPWGGVAGLGVAYNAMIAPFEPYTLRGVVWYQGESNTGEPSTYQALLSNMITDWRSKFHADLPFLIVQLPDYGAPPTNPGPSGWAQLREAQRATVADDKNAALVVTIDIGNHANLHPVNKQEVGRRLALAARHLVYGEDIIPTGPTALRAQRHKNRIVVTFTDIEKGLVAYNANEPIGFELCGTTEASCRYATAHIKADRVSLAVPPRLTPTHVRYCWADGPICTLADGARLPAGPFDLPIEQSHNKKVIRHHTRSRKLHAR